MKTSTVISLVLIFHSLMSVALAKAPDFSILPGTFSNYSGRENRDQANDAATNSREDAGSLEWQSDLSKHQNRGAAKAPLRMAGSSGTRGGGSGIVEFRGDDIVSVSLLDLTRSDFTIRSSTLYCKKSCSSSEIETESEKILRQTLDQIRNRLPNFWLRLTSVEKEVGFPHWTPTNGDIPLISDYGPAPQLGPHQKHVQLAYRRSSVVIYNEKYYQYLDAIHRAGLKLHELIYAISGFEKSTAIQKLVAYLLSTEFATKEDPRWSADLMAKLDLQFLTIPNLELPLNAREVSHLDNKPNELCGVLVGISINSQENLSTRLMLKFDVNRPHLKHSDLNPSDLNSLADLMLNPPYFNNSHEIFLEKSESLSLLRSLYVLKFQLTGQFPKYRFPTVTVPNDIVCVDSDLKSVVSLSSALLYTEKGNKAELQSALYEREYFERINQYNQNPGDILRSAINEIEDSLREAKSKEAAEQNNAENLVKKQMNKIVDTRILGQITVRFEER
jgi:hypothetical protein